MKSSVYEVRGCAGSRKIYEVETLLTADEARRRARERNQAHADGCGMSYRAYSRDRCGGEGWFFGMRSGKDGYAAGSQYA